MENKQQFSPEQLRKMKIIIFAAIGIPLIISLIFTLMQWYPATYTIDYLVDKNGEFSIKMAIGLNWIALMLAEIPLVIIAGLIGKIIKR